ncbi:hypothetical protein V2J09_016392 [Rumex salicifolius]
MVEAIIDGMCYQLRTLLNSLVKQLKEEYISKTRINLVLSDAEEKKETCRWGGLWMRNKITLASSESSKFALQKADCDYRPFVPSQNLKGPFSVSSSLGRLMDSVTGSTSTGFLSYGLSWRRKMQNPSPDRSKLQEDIEQDEFQFASSCCLSSYYSVFVVRLSIMVLLAILIGMLTILTWHFTKVYTTRSLNSLAYGLRCQLLQRPLLRMWSILNSTAEITTTQVKLSEYVIKRYSSQPSTQAQQVELYDMMKDMTWALFASRKALNSITINYKNGFVQAFHRDHRSNNTFYIYSNLVNYSIATSYEMEVLSSHQKWNDQSIKGNLSAIWYREPLDPTSGERIGKPRQIPPDDLINIAGPSQVPDGVASWHVSVSKFIDSPLLSAALPVWDPSNESIVAVVGVTTSLYSVGQLMKELVEFYSGHIYLTSQEGYLLATSTNAPLLKNSSKGPELVKATESNDDVIREGAQWLQNAYPDKFPPSHDVHVENAMLGNQNFYIDSFFLNLKRLPMAGVIIIPREYIMGKVDERTLRTLIILISVSLCILIIGCICIFILTTGVSKEMKLRAALISQLEARRRAEASSNFKSHHELRTPMAAVIGLLDILLCDDYLSNEQFAMITQIRKCSTALLRLLNNILDLSKVESGKLALEDTEFDLGRELEGLIDMFSVQCVNHNVEIVLDLSDDMPKLVRGDSARVVQVFANLVSNSIKFTSSGHIIIRGWCQNSTTSSNINRRSLLNQKETTAKPIKSNKQQQISANNAGKPDKKTVLCFEVDDTGCGIDPGKWKSVFESFEQADPSTTRKHGGTGLGLCIVKTLVDKMGGEISVVKKDGPGTLMKFNLLLNPSSENATQHSLEIAQDKLMVLLALGGSMGRSIFLEWLRKKGVLSWEASDWNELTQTLKEVFQINSFLGTDSSDPIPKSRDELSRDDAVHTSNSFYIIVIDIALLDLSTDIWKEQINYLGRYSRNVKFAWILNHNTSNSVKMELWQKGHLLMVNKPMYKAKMIQILEAAIKEWNLEMQKAGASSSSDLLECYEIDPIRYDGVSSDDSDNAGLACGDSEIAVQTGDRRRKVRRPQSAMVNNYLVDFTEAFCSTSCNGGTSNEKEIQRANSETQDHHLVSHEDKNTSHFHKLVNGKQSLQGLRILLAEDTPVLQRVATIMLEKLGATVIVVSDGVQAVDALKCSPNSEGCEATCRAGDGKSNQNQDWNSLCIDLVLMDCQMPKMDGYDATKAIRESEVGTTSHIPIVAVTAHAMTSDEAKCLEVGMDAYLTKPIDCKLMIGFLD